MAAAVRIALSIFAGVVINLTIASIRRRKNKHKHPDDECANLPVW